jgi:hypothetical protein
MSVLTADLIVTHNKLNIKGLSSESMDKTTKVAAEGAQSGGKDKTKAGNNSSKMNA